MTIEIIMMLGLLAVVGFIVYNKVIQKEDSGDSETPPAPPPHIPIKGIPSGTFVSHGTGLHQSEPALAIIEILFFDTGSGMMRKSGGIDIPFEWNTNLKSDNYNWVIDVTDITLNTQADHSLMTQIYDGLAWDNVSSSEEGTFTGSFLGNSNSDDNLVLGYRMMLSGTMQGSSDMSHNITINIDNDDTTVANGEMELKTTLIIK